MSNDMSNDNVLPIPPSYTLEGALKKLGLGARQSFYQAGLHEQVHRYLVGQRTYVYDAADVDVWAARMVRRRILIAWGLLSEKSPLTKAPVKDSLDTTCPVCGGFALRHPEMAQTIRCEAGHETPGGGQKRKR